MLIEIFDGEKAHPYNTIESSNLPKNFTVVEVRVTPGTQITIDRVADYRVIVNIPNKRFELLSTVIRDEWIMVFVAVKKG